jgi:excisionase family DNA binding protein
VPSQPRFRRRPPHLRSRPHRKGIHALTTPPQASARPAARTAHRSSPEHPAAAHHPLRPVSQRPSSPSAHGTVRAHGQPQSPAPRPDEHATTVSAPSHVDEPLPHPLAEHAERTAEPGDKAERTQLAAPPHGIQLFPQLPPGVRPLAYTPEQAAVLLAVRPSWLRRAAAAGEIACTYLGKHLRFSDADLHAIIADNAAGPRPE